MNDLITIKIICLFLAVWFGFINMVKWQRNQTIHWFNVVIMSVSIVGFVVIQFNLYQ